MKKKIAIVALCIINFFYFSAVQADIIHSTSAGGDWNNPTTWQEGTVPATADDVVITGPGLVYVYSTIGTQPDVCHDLTVNSGAILRQKTNGVRYLEVNGNVINNGSITDTTSSGSIYMHIYGNLTNNGIWNNRRIYLEGSGTQSVFNGAGNYFGCQYFTDNVNTSDTEALSDLEFFETIIDLNGGNLNYTITSEKLSMHGGRIQDATINLNTGYLYMDNNAYLHTNTTIYDPILQGIINISTSPIVFAGNIIVEGILQNKINASHTLNVNGNITNDGTIKTTNNNFNVYITGNVVNNGVWENAYTYLSGASAQQISCGPGNSFACDYFIDNDISSENLALTDLAFEGTVIDLNDAKLTMPVATGSSLSVDGGRVQNAEIDMNNGYLIMSNNAYLYTNSIFHDPILQGTINIASIPVIFHGEVIVDGTLQNRINGSYTLEVDGIITNNGTIKNTNNNFNLYVSGNIVNNGVWENTNTYFDGISSHTFTQGVSGVFSGTNLYAVAGTGNINALSGLDFNGTNVDLNGDTLLFDPVKGAAISFTDAILRDGVVYGNYNDLLMDDDSYVADLVLYDFNLRGKVNIYGNNVTFEGNNIVTDTLQNYSTSSNLTVNGLLTNNGVIRDQSNNLILKLNSDLINNGTCSNHQVVFNSSSDQHITCLNDQSISSVLVSNTDPLSKIIADGDLHFLISNFNLDGVDSIQYGHIIGPFTVVYQMAFAIYGEVVGSSVRDYSIVHYPS